MKLIPNNGPEIYFKLGLEVYISTFEKNIIITDFYGSVRGKVLQQE
jgi:hypothetical protein